MSFSGYNARMKLYQIDAFAAKVFQGNPAAVVPLTEWLPDAVMQAIASENNLAETAFFVPSASGYHLRWFTPTQEVPFCGHATLASAFVVLNEISPTEDAVEFQTEIGLLTVRRDGSRFTMDFPRHALVPTDAPDALLAGLGAPPREVYLTPPNPNYYAVYAAEAEIRALSPDFTLLSTLESLGVVVTAPGDEVDFVSRYFAPGLGIPEDPVTGSIHCALAPYWAARLGKNDLHARQVSARGGELYCVSGEARVLVSGSAVKYLEGEIYV